MRQEEAGKGLARSSHAVHKRRGIERFGVAAATRVALGGSGALFALCALAALPISACSAEYHMDSRNGSDVGSGGREQPWRSLERVGKVVFKPGDTVSFLSGSQFEGGFEVKQSGTSNAPITFKQFGDGPAPRFTNPNSVALSGNAIRINASYIVVEGLFFERCPLNPVAAEIHELGAVFLTTNANHCVVRACEMTQTPAGVTVYGEHNLVTRNYVHDNNAPIMPHWGPMCVVICGSHNEVSYNTFENYSAPSEEFGHDGGAIEINDRSLPKEDIRIHHNLSLRNQGFIEWVGRVTQNTFYIHHNVCMDYQAFLGFTGPCTNIRVDNNTVVRTLAHAQPDSEDVVFWNYSGGNSNITFRNNIFVYDPEKVEPVFSRGEMTHNHNLFYRTDHSRIPKQANRWAYERKYLGGGAQLHIGDKIGDPLFRDVGKGDFRLQSGSPAIDTGIDLPYKQDLDRNPVPWGKGTDMGAYEYTEGK